MEIFQNNAKFLQKELAAKNNLTEHFMEVQTDVLKFVLSATIIQLGTNKY